MRKIDLKFKNKGQMYVYILFASMIIFILFYIGINKNMEIAIENSNKYNIAEDIRINGNLFSKSPLGKNYEKGSVQSFVYSILVYNKSWRVHRILEGLVSSGGLLFGIIGIIIANIKFSKNKNKDFNIKIKNLIIFTLVFVILFLIINYLILHFMDSKNINAIELSKTADNIYSQFNIWKPSVVYDLFAILYVIILFLAYGSSGFLLEILLNNIIASAFIYGLLGIVFNFYPISPVFFIIELSPLFLVPINKFLVLTGARWYYFLFGIIMFIIYYFLAKKINSLKK